MRIMPLPKSAKTGTSMPNRSFTSLCVMVMCALILLGIHDGAQHLQHVRAFGISNILISIFRTWRHEALSHPQRAGIIRCYAEIVFFKDAGSQPIPEFDIVLLPIARHTLLQE